MVMVKEILAVSITNMDDKANHCRSLFIVMKELTSSFQLLQEYPNQDEYIAHLTVMFMHREVSR